MNYTLNIVQMKAHPQFLCNEMHRVKDYQNVIVWSLSLAPMWQVNTDKSFPEADHQSISSLRHHLLPVICAFHWHWIEKLPALWKTPQAAGSRDGSKQIDSQLRVSRWRHEHITDAEKHVCLAALIQTVNLSVRNLDLFVQLFPHDCMRAVLRLCCL